MAIVTVGDTKFTFSPKKKPLLWDGYSLGMTIAVHNEFISYENSKHRCDFEEVEQFYFTLRRLIAGGYRSEPCFRIEGANMSVAIGLGVLNPENCSRERLRTANYTVTISLAFVSNLKNEPNGAYTIVLHREEIKSLADGLQADLAEYANARSKRHGKYLLAGVSPQGYKGCNYWYFDPMGKTKPNTFVWVKMGKNKTLQLVYVDCVRKFNEYDTPHSVNGNKLVLKQATQEDIVKAQEIWRD